MFIVDEFTIFLNKFKGELSRQIENYENKMNSNQNMYLKDNNELITQMKNIEGMCKYMLEIEKLVGHDLKFNK